MIPAFLILGFGRSKRVRVPLLLFLLWPLVGIAWLGVLLAEGVMWLAKRDRSSLKPARIALSSLSHLSGLKIDVSSQDGTWIYISFF